MTAQKGHLAHPLLGPTDADALRRAVERLRGFGLSHTEAATEMLRKNFYDFIDSETETTDDTVPRLRIVKR